MTRRVLIVSSGLPHRSWGFGTRVLQLSRHLGQRHDVTVVAFAEPGEPEREAESLDLLRADCRLVIVPRLTPRGPRRRAAQLWSVVSPTPFSWRDLHTQPMEQELARVFTGPPFDVIQVESSQMCSYDFPAGVPLVLDEHNIEYELLARMEQGESSPLRRFYNGREHRTFRKLEQDLWRRVAGCALTSEREEQIVRAEAPGTPTAIVPNAVDSEFFSPSPSAPKPNSLVFTGILSYRPNLDAARFLVDDIVPRIREAFPDSTTTIVGKGDPEDLAALRGPGVTVTGWVPDVRPYMEEAAVAVVPIRMGSGTRLKVLESLSMGKAMVSTSVGCEGVDVRDGRDLLVADDPVAFADQVGRVFNDPVLARSLGEAGRALVVDRYSWTDAAGRLDDLHGRAVEAQRGR
jgi:glycosyltransferase involved in cell wall biosynthesis